MRSVLVVLLIALSGCIADDPTEGDDESSASAPTALLIEETHSLEPTVFASGCAIATGCVARSVGSGATALEFTLEPGTYWGEVVIAWDDSQPQHQQFYAYLWLPGGEPEPFYDLVASSPMRLPIPPLTIDTQQHAIVDIFVVDGPGASVMPAVGSAFVNVAAATVDVDVTVDLQRLPMGEERPPYQASLQWDYQALPGAAVYSPPGVRAGAWWDYGISWIGFDVRQGNASGSFTADWTTIAPDASGAAGLWLYDGEEWHEIAYHSGDPPISFDFDLELTSDMGYLYFDGYHDGGAATVGYVTVPTDYRFDLEIRTE